MLLTSPTAPGDDVRFQLWGGGDGASTCEIGPSIRKQPSCGGCPEKPQAAEFPWLTRGAEGFSQATELATLPLTVPPWALSGEGMVRVRVIVDASSAGVSVRFNDAVLAVSP
ncbi:hypothetical protein MNBD_ACTINO02-1014 [hydrothermal vent metagenome]|uniref:Uncharacterized protein n=1 Tax=hydrothermal vent metagenome TaxID=652676 RepID=A0A3B0RPW5_9ZZZZ